MASIDQHIPAGTTGPGLPEGRWRVDRRRSEVSFAVQEMWGLRTVRGVFGACDGSLTVRAGGASGELTLEVASLDTGDKRRDQHLRSAAFFDAERHPRLRFETTAVTRGTIVGELVIGARRTRLAVPVEVAHFAEDKLRLEGTTTVSRTAVGLGWNKLGMIRDEVVLRADLILERVDS
jgi:polyisoprenoid-binding protein YceI